jgi:YesN/AraC family two-component response regulator
MLDKVDSLEEMRRYLYTTIIDMVKAEAIMDMDTKCIVEKTKQYIEKHYDEEFVVKELALKFAVNPCYFSTIFKKETGKTVMQYITNIRVQNACDLLIETQASIADISQSVGYQDAQYFYRVFKKHTGKTPLAYRNQE